MSTAKDTSHKFYIKQVEGVIKKLFTGLIDIEDAESKKTSDLEIQFLTRGLAAYSLYVLADINAELAAESIVDGFNDNGIDAIYFDRNNNILWLIQSKWTQKAKGQPDTAGMKKFKDGVLNLRDNKLDRFNEKIRNRKREILEAIESPGINIKAVIAYTGKEFSKHNRTTLNDLIEDLNDYDEIGSYEIFNLESAFKALTESINSNNISVEFKLSNWGKVEEPYQAFYGQICAADVAEWWVKYKSKLFNKNIRDFIGTSEVNEEISRTISSEPEFFWYFNNGITVLCEEIRKKDISRNRNTGDFICKGMSVINGAQTIGSIGHIYEKQKEKIEEAEIFIKFISLEYCEEDFGVRVTRATNTQNKVENRDFISLDSQQERLKQELKTFGINYHYKRASELIVDDENFSLREATVALACAHPDLNLTIFAKKQIDKLWADVSKKPYTSIFNKKLNAITLWRSVEVSRAFEQELKYRQESINGKENKQEYGLYKYGDKFILHIVFRKLKSNALGIIDNKEFHSYIEKTVPSLIDRYVKSSVDYLKKSHPNVMHARFFNSIKKCKELKSAIIS